MNDKTVMSSEQNIVKNFSVGPSRPDSIIRARRRLLLTLLLFSAALILSLGLLLKHIYSELNREAFYRYQTSAREFTRELNEKILSVLERESARSFDDYSYYKIAKGAVSVNEQSIVVSGLAQELKRFQIAGLVGYFQINPYGTLQSPLLPQFEIGKATQLNEKESEIRLSQVNRLYTLLSKVNFGQASSGPTFPSALREEKVSRPLVQYMQDQNIAQVNLNLQQSADKKFFAQNLGIPNDADNFYSLELNVSLEGFRALMISNEHLTFVRRVFVDQRQYWQGFVVSASDFLSELVNLEVLKTSFPTAVELYISSRTGQWRYTATSKNEMPQISNINNRHEIEFHSAQLNPPLDDFTVGFRTKLLSKGVGLEVVNKLALLLSVVIILGLLGIYHLSGEQISLAQERSNFVSAVTHELKTPLTSIRMYAEMLKTGMIQDADKRESSYNFILRESERLSRLISNVLYFAKLGSGTSVLHLDKHLAADLLNEIKASVSYQVEKSNFSLNLNAPTAVNSDEIHVLVDKDAFVQIFINLVDNALKFCAKTEPRQIDLGYRIEQSQADSEGQLVFFVRDYGPGINSHQRRRIFDLFYRVGDELTRSTSGTGIGLALVQELAWKMGADVKIVTRTPGIEFQIKFKESSR